MKKNDRFWSIAATIVFVAGLVMIGLFGIGARNVRAAVPTWTVGFDENTNFEKSLEVFLYNLFRDLQEREEEFELAYDLSKIEKARDDVNKLIYEAFVELRSEPLLIEFRKIVSQCDEFPGNFGGPGGFFGGPTETTKVCQFASEIVETLKGRGVEIIVDDHFDKDAPFDPSSLAANELCINGVRTAEGECIIIKQDGRIITNPENFIFEEPVRKARDFVQCYFAPWRHFPFASEDVDRCSEFGYTQAGCSVANVCRDVAADGGQCESDKIRDKIKQAFLLDMTRKLSSLETSPPESFYTPARCELILNNLQCPLIGNYEDTLSTGNNVIVQNQSEACKFRAQDINSTLDAPLGTFFSFTDLKQAAQQKNNNTPNGVIARVQETIDRIIQDYEQLRTAQYVAGQGLRPEKYLVGYQSYTDDEYSQLLQNINEGNLDEDETNLQPSGEYYFVDTEDVISPAIILLSKLQAATQAQFDLAAQAFKAPRTIDPETGEIIALGSERLEQYEEQPENAFNFSPARGGETVDGKTIDAQGDLIGVRVKDDEHTLVAPFEDTQIKLPAGYLNGELPQSIYEDPALRGNYFNQWYKDILQLHQQNFSTIVKQWFRQPHKSYFIEDR